MENIIIDNSRKYYLLDNCLYSIVIENNLLITRIKKVLATIPTSDQLEYVTQLFNFIDKYKVRYAMFDERVMDNVNTILENNPQVFDYLAERLRHSAKFLKVVILITNKQVYANSLINSYKQATLGYSTKHFVAEDLVQAFLLIQSLNVALIDKITALSGHSFTRFNVAVASVISAIVATVTNYWLSAKLESVVEKLSKLLEHLK